MDHARPGRDVLDRSLRTSWIAAATVALFLAPARPYDALAVLAGQLIACLHFIFLRKIVKLFTEKRGGLALAIIAKVLVVYGGLFALMTWDKIRYAPLCAGFAIPFAVLFLKSTMLAFGAGPASLTRRAKGAMLVLAVVGAASLATTAHAQTSGPAQH